MDGNQRWKEGDRWIGTRITTAEGQSFKKQLEFTRTFRVQCAIWKKKNLRKELGVYNQHLAQWRWLHRVLYACDLLLYNFSRMTFNEKGQGNVSFFAPCFRENIIIFWPWWFSVCSPLSSWVIMHETLKAQISSTSLIKVSVGSPPLPLSLITVIVFWSGLKWANFNPLIHSLFCECS